MPNKEPVEAYKLSDGCKSWMNKFRQLKQVQGLFQKSLQQEKRMITGMGEKYKQFMQIMQGHVAKMPQIKTKEVEAQDNEPEPGQMDYNAVGMPGNPGAAMKRNQMLGRH